MSFRIGYAKPEFQKMGINKGGQRAALVALLILFVLDIFLHNSFQTLVNEHV
jgi:hypothetical protein